MGCFLPSQMNWEDSYGKQKGKQEVFEEITQQEEQEERE